MSLDSFDYINRLANVNPAGWIFNNVDIIHNNIVVTKAT